ncbi:MAG: hypothetical protein QXO55_07740 [Candidatus Korarchaeum sp.]
MEYEYGAYVTVLGIVIGVGSDQILIKGIWEGESPIRVDDQGVNSALLISAQISPGDFVKATIQAVERRVPRSGADLDSPMIPGGEVGFRLVKIEKLTPGQLIDELTKISRYIYSIHFKPLGGAGDVERKKGDFPGLGEVSDEGLDDWTWVRGNLRSRQHLA